MKSVLPPAEEIKKQQLTMRIELLNVNDYPSNLLTTKFDVVSNRTLSERKKPIMAHVYKIDEPRTLGFIPTKVWRDDRMESWVLLYYINDTLPNAARPFGDKPCYLFTYVPRITDTVEYDPTSRVFIDQSMNPAGGIMTYIVIFGEDQLQNVLTTQWDGTPWSDAVILY